MKKIIVALATLFIVGGTSFAQTTTPAGKAQTTHTKKDGTPDKRYKENKPAKDTAVVHKKKDGTADKRYKENKTKKTN